MNFAVLAAVIGVDLLVLVIVFRLFKKHRAPEDLLEDLAEERNALRHLHAEVKNELQHTQAENQRILDKATQIAAEVEQEIAASQGVLASHAEQLGSEFAERFADPMKELGSKQNSIEVLFAKIEREKNALQHLLKKTEKLIQLINAKIPTQDVIRDMEYKKYADVRMLLAQGHTIDFVAKELGLAEAEVQLVKNLAYQ